MQPNNKKVPVKVCLCSKGFVVANCGDGCNLNYSQLAQYMYWQEIKHLHYGQQITGTLQRVFHTRSSVSDSSRPPVIHANWSTNQITCMIQEQTAHQIPMVFFNCDRLLLANSYVVASKKIPLIFFPHLSLSLKYARFPTFFGVIF